MSSTVMAVRAVTSEFARGLLRPILFVGIGAYAVILAIVIWITVAVNSWWILLAFIPTVIFCVGLALWIGVWLATRRLAPDNMNKQQRKATKKVVEQVSRVAEQLGTPRFILIFRVIKDVLFPPKTNQTLIGELTGTPGQLHKSFEELRKLF